jgi:hypothetical protein
MESYLVDLGAVYIPPWGGVRVQMMPVLMGDKNSIPRGLERFSSTIGKMFEASPCKDGVGYLTIDERFVKAGETHRRPGLHVDGMGSWGSGGGWGKQGMLMTSNFSSCVAWQQEFYGEPIKGTDSGDPNEGDCEHLREQCEYGYKVFLKSFSLYWCGPMCVHEVIPCEQDYFRTFVRLSMPSDSEWPANCTPNPLGVKPGKVGVPRRILGVYGYGA